MGAQIREYRQRIRSVSATKKITRAMELMAASRVIKAQQAVRESTPYAGAMTRMMAAVASYSDADHPLTTEKEEVKRAAVVIMTSDRGLAGAYSSSVIKESERVIARLQEEGKEVVPYLLGRKVIGYYKFRQRDFAAEWSGFSEKPTIEIAREVAERIIEDFTHEDEEIAHDEVHIVYTRFVSMVTQEPQVTRMLPLEMVDAPEGEETGPDDLLPLYSFEPSADEALDLMLPRYVVARLYNCMLQAAASELAARQRAMKSATDNAEDLIKKYTRLANQARQAEITQEISEIVGGASALAESK